MRKFTSIFRWIALIFIIHSVTSLAANMRVVPLNGDQEKHSISLIFEEEIASKDCDLLQKLSLDSLQRAQHILQLQLQDSVEIYFNSSAPEHNGLATLIPRDRIIVQTRFPESHDSLKQSKDYIFETLLHEWAHILTSSQRSSFFRFLKHLVGNLSSPNGLWPRWIHEGLAVWTEGHFWGRPQSGVIDLDIKRAGEFLHRTGQDPLPNTQMDGGNLYSASNSRRSIPYHFGYLFWKEWIKNHPETSIAEFTQKASKSLGLSFRSTFQSLKAPLDQNFFSMKETWTHFPPQTSLPPHSEILSEAFRIRGPFPHSKIGIWIEEDKLRKTHIVFLKSGKAEKHLWPNRLGRATHVSMTQNPNTQYYGILALNRFEKSVLHFFSSHKRLCQISMPNLREILISSYPNEKLIWIEEALSGKSKLYQAPILDWEQCKLGMKEVLFETAAFESLRDLNLGPKNEILYSWGQERNTLHEKRNSIPHNQPSCYESVSQINPLSNTNSGFELAQYSAPQYTGPILIQKSNILNLALATGSTQHQIIENTKILVNQSLWDKDQIILTHLDSFQNSTITLKDCPPALNPMSIEEHFSKPYQPLKTIFPNFWIPSILVQDDNSFFSAQSFFSDITDNYSGQILGASDSELKNFIFFFNLKTPSFFSNNSKFTQRIQIALEPSRFHSKTHHKGIEGLYLDYIPEESSLLTYQFSFGLRHLWAKAQNTLSSYHLFSPTLEQSLGTTHSLRGFEEPFRSSTLLSSVSIINQSQWLEALQNVSRLSAVIDWNERFVSYFNADYAFNNNPSPKFDSLTWGAPQMPSAFQNHLLNRAFSGPSKNASNIIRVHKSFDWNIFRPQWALSWNRLSLSAIDLRLFMESISYRLSPNAKEDTYLRTFFSTIGAQTQFFGQTLGYVDYRLLLGIYHGWGTGAQTRFELGLKTQLDL